MSQEIFTPQVAATPSITDGRVAGFSLHLENFDGPFDLLLQLISRHKMDITEVALGTVTDEFISYIKQLENSENGWDLDKTTEFLVVAATLLDLKAAKLLPSGEVDDESDLALLEARDLLFARLLQYRAFKEIAAIFSERIEREEKSFPRTVALEPHFAQLLPEVLIGVGAQRFAAIANRVLTPKTTPIFSIDHLHRPLVSVAEQAVKVVEMLRKAGRVTFRSLVSDASSTLVVVARFLALLELYREGVVRFEQVISLGELQITWVGSADGEVRVSDEFDSPPQPVDEADNV
ncbi:MAG: segregation/condensation protein A [Actinobacteria bacterium]|nr:segregation/condensation protein A [Actinomycetota bacterium]MSZ43006.1 segregation/condensation protein A [Actinomycetota bacterium]MTA57060.1 segregation/condensation protein A [Actinomycetota bacterium]MTA99379.1 segregation/condensation protein A [Actinomycetota bacterium]